MQSEKIYIPGVNTEKGILQCGGKAEFYYNILLVCLDNFNELIKEMRELLDADDIPNYTIKIHATKGSCYNIGADKWGDDAKALEMAARANDKAFIEANHNNFIESLKELLALIKEELVKQGKIVEENVNSPSVADNESSAFDMYLNKIKKAAEDFDFPEIQDIIEEMQKKTWSLEEAEKLKKLDKDARKVADVMLFTTNPLMK